jgi:hypothetical protein
LVLSELANIREHWTRYRDVTLQHVEMLSDDEMAWRPQPELFTGGQHLIHILQTEKYYARGWFHEDWDATRLHFPTRLPSKDALRLDFKTTRMGARRFGALAMGSRADHARARRARWSPLRWWLWFVLNMRSITKRSLPLSSSIRQGAAVLCDGHARIVPDIRIRAEWAEFNSGEVPDASVLPGGTFERRDRGARRSFSQCFLCELSALCVDRGPRRY